MRGAELAVGAKQTSYHGCGTSESRPDLANLGWLWNAKKNKLSVNTLLTGFSQLPRERSAFYVVYLILFFF